MSRPAVFFDRDNTLIANDGYLGDPAGVVLIAGAAKAIVRARAMGFAVVTVSNQSGVARGMFTEEAVHRVNSRLDELLQDQHPNARIDRHEYCPFHPDAIVERYRQDSELRKPLPGMILQAAERLNIDLTDSWIVGDAPRDIEAGKAAGCRTILFTDPTLKASSATEAASSIKPDFTADSLEKALDIIEQNKMNSAKPEDESNVEQNGDGVSTVSADTEAATHPEPAENKTEDEPADVAKPEAPSGARRKMTFAERVRAGTFQPAREPGVAAPAVADRPKRAAAGEFDTNAAAPPRGVVVADADVEPGVKPTEAMSESEVLEPILQEILDEIRMMRRHQPGTEFAVSKLLAGIVQVLVLPALFFAYLHRDTAGDLQSILLLATFLQTLTIALLIMGKQQ